MDLSAAQNRLTSTGTSANFQRGLPGRLFVVEPEPLDVDLVITRRRRFANAQQLLGQKSTVPITDVVFQVLGELSATLCIQLQARSVVYLGVIGRQQVLDVKCVVVVGGHDASQPAPLQHQLVRV